VFANEMLGLTLVNAATIAAASLALEAGLAPRTAVLAWAGVQVAVGTAYFLWAAASERRLAARAV
jgi:hypothetical protein